MGRGLLENGQSHVDTMRQFHEVSEGGVQGQGAWHFDAHTRDD